VILAQTKRKKKHSVLAEFDPGKLYPPMTFMYAFSSSETHISLRLLEYEHSRLPDLSTGRQSSMIT